MPVRSKRSPKPGWLKMKMPSGDELFKLKKHLEKKNLHTICQDAKCPNMGECWNRNHATFLIMGNVCSRNCLFCSVPHGKSAALDPNEGEKITEVARILELSYAVITSVTRDDLEDGGSAHFASVVTTLKRNIPGLLIEVLIPDFKGNPEQIERVLASGPDVLNHNLETVQSLYPKMNRNPENYRVSLNVLKYAKSRNFVTKSGIMVGLGEQLDELKTLFKDLLDHGVDLLTIGQYLQPTKSNLKVEKFYSPEAFEELKGIGLEMGFKGIEAGPFVRSSYRAEEMYKQVIGRKRSK